MKSFLKWNKFRGCSRKVQQRPSPRRRLIPRSSLPPIERKPRLVGLLECLQKWWFPKSPRLAVIFVRLLLLLRLLVPRLLQLRIPSVCEEPKNQEPKRTRRPWSISCKLYKQLLLHPRKIRTNHSHHVMKLLLCLLRQRDGHHDSSVLLSLFFSRQSEESLPIQYYLQIKSARETIRRPALLLCAPLSRRRRRMPS